MLTLLDSIYYMLRREEIERASTRLKRIKTDTILQYLAKLCWKYNIQYEVIVKTSDVLTMKLSGTKETVVFKYHKSCRVSKEEVDCFMNELDENRAYRGVYITTGEFEVNNKNFFKSLFLKKDILLEDNFSFIKANLGLMGKTIRNFRLKNLNFYKYLPK